jgi:hypothetical protein
MQETSPIFPRVYSRNLMSILFNHTIRYEWLEQEITRNPEKFAAAKKYVYNRLADG